VSDYEVNVGNVRLNIAVILDHPYIDLSMLKNSKRVEYFFWTERKRSLSTITTPEDIVTDTVIPKSFLVKMPLTGLRRGHEVYYLFFEEKIWWPSMTEVS
jgi:hypothetical protein